MVSKVSAYCNNVKEVLYHIIATSLLHNNTVKKNISGLDEEKKAESHSILLAGYLNLAMSYLKMCDNPRARDHAAKALEMDNCSVKAYFRRGQVSHVRYSLQ